GADPLVRFRVPDDLDLPVQWHVEVILEKDGHASLNGSTEARELGAILHGVEQGYHRARVTLRSAGDTRSADTDLIVTPTSCWTAEEAVGAGRAFGLWTNLYSVRSETGWGIGDLADLRRLAELGGREGA